MSFIESPRFPISVGFGTAGGPGYNTNVVVLDSGYEQRNDNWVYPRHRYDVATGVKHTLTLEDLIAFFHVAKGRFNGFRYKDIYDYKSCSIYTDPASTDQEIATADGVVMQFQLKKTYTKGIYTQSRIITKPVTGTVLISISGITVTNYSVDLTTGIITFSAEEGDSILSINQANPCEVTTVYPHGLITGESVYLYGIVGPTILNSNRYKITVTASDKFTLDGVDSTAYPAYVSGGEYRTQPQNGEVIKAGYEFDVPVRFDIDQLNTSLDTYRAGRASVPLVEIRV